MWRSQVVDEAKDVIGRDHRAIARRRVKIAESVGDKEPLGFQRGIVQLRKRATCNIVWQTDAALHGVPIPTAGSMFNPRIGLTDRALRHDVALPIRVAEIRLPIPDSTHRRSGHGRTLTSPMSGYY